jgi:hypothetical protein
MNKRDVKTHRRRQSVLLALSEMYDYAEMYVLPFFTDVDVNEWIKFAHVVLDAHTNAK